MTDNTSLVNLALQAFGARTTVTAAELAANSTNEAIQANLTFNNTRDSLLRLAPWDCALKTSNLVYITSAPGTPENTSPATNLWQRGQPRPPWAYEYQYPVDCLRACWIIPASQTGFTGTPITTAVTGGAANTWLGGPIVFKVATDQFYPANSVAIVNPGTGYLTNDIVTLDGGPVGSQPWGGPARVQVTSINLVNGAILTAKLVPQVIDSATLLSGSYFVTPYNHAFGQASIESSVLSPSIASGATFTLGWANLVSQRVILTNQEFAILVYVQQVTDPNVWDPMFQDAFTEALGADLCMALSGDKTLANMCIQRANTKIKEARVADGNEGLTINDVTPDWIRVRGYGWDIENLTGPYSSFDWGAFLPSYG